MAEREQGVNMEMTVNTPEVIHLVDEYDFIFSSGMTMPVSVDLAAGDKISFSDETVMIYIAPKPSPNNPKIMLPSTDVTLFVKHIIATEHRVREVVALSPEEQFLWTQTLKQIAGVH